jgi:hypothetical protein
LVGLSISRSQVVATLVVMSSSAIKNGLVFIYVTWLGSKHVIIYQNNYKPIMASWVAMTNPNKLMRQHGIGWKNLNHHWTTMFKYCFYVVSVENHWVMVF